MSTEEHKALIRRFWESFNQGRDDQTDLYYAPEIVCYMGGGQPLRGLEANKAMLAGFRAAFSGIRVSVQDLIAEGDRVVARWTCSMQHTGEFQGIPASHAEVTITSIEIYRIVNGRIVEQWSEMDNMSLLQQMGAFPTPE